MFYYLNPSIVVYSIMVIFNGMCMYEECDSYHVFEKSQRSIEIEIEKGVGDRGIF